MAGQTVWYGLSSIAARFINMLLTPYLTYNTLISTADFGKLGAMYAAIPLLNVIFTYGMETAYFRFIQKKAEVEDVHNTATISLLVSTIVLSAILWMNQSALAHITKLEDLPTLIQISIVIIGLDALSTIPFARLRNEGRPKLFAFIKIMGIVINIVFTVFFLSYCPAQVAKDPAGWASNFYNPATNPIIYVFIATALQSGFTLLLLTKWLLPKKWHFNFALWKEMMVYSLPMLIAGMGGMVNEVFDRLMLGWWLPSANDFADEQRGIYNACYKLSILITLFIQAFRMGAEPFFFKQLDTAKPQYTYARVMKFFVITITFIFLSVSLFLPIWQYFIDEKYRVGLNVVPILLVANMCLGVYYNLSIWYKVTNRTMAGSMITLAGTAITIIINWVFIPRYSYLACAWATLLCYGTMMVLSYTWGQKVYPIPYAWKKLLAYFVIVLTLFFVYKGLTALWDNFIYNTSVALLLVGAYGFFILKVERKEFLQIPFTRKFIR